MADYPMAYFSKHKFYADQLKDFIIHKHKYKKVLAGVYYIDKCKCGKVQRKKER